MNTIPAFCKMLWMTICYLGVDDVSWRWIYLEVKGLRPIFPDVVVVYKYFKDRLLGKKYQTTSNF